MLLVNNIVTQNFIIGVHLQGKSCTHIVHFIITTSRPRPFKYSELSFKTLKYKHIYLHSHKILILNWICICVKKKVLKPLPKTSKTADQVKLILSPKQRANPAASRTRTCTNAAAASEKCSSRFWHRAENESLSGHAKIPPASHKVSATSLKLFGHGTPTKSVHFF